MAARTHEAYRRVLVPVSERRSCEQAIVIACRLAAERGASLTVVNALEVPTHLPLDAQMRDEEQAAREVLAEARSIAELYGVRASTQVVRARSAAEAILASAGDSAAELVVLAAPRRRRANRSTPLLGRTVAAVLAQAPCRVMVVAR